jgi:glyoxylate/hydroxypyruvate reductase
MMSTLVIRVDPERRAWWKETLQKMLPDLRIVLWDEDQFDPRDIEYAVVWNPPLGFFKDLVNLKCVASVGAGVAHILKDPNYPKRVPIIRTVGEDLRRRMSEYVALHVLRFHRRLPEIEAAQKNHQWVQYVEPLARETTVGVMGLGNLGGFAARTLAALGYKVAGWARRPKNFEGVTVYAGNEQLADFLANTKILVCMLPETPLTINILNQQTFDAMPKGSYLINVGRGQNLVEGDLLRALDDGKLNGATLDVFWNEPLPSEHPFWSHSKILITFHTASAIEPKVGGQIIANNIKAFISGVYVPDIVDIEQGY